MLEEVTGIVVSEHNYGEKSKIINLFTKEKGIIGIMVKGGRSLKSPLRSVTGKLSYGTFEIYYKKDKLSKLNEVNIINNFSNIKKDIELIKYASYITDLAHQVEKHKHDSEVFDNLILALIKINEGINPNVITNILELKYLDYLGIKPELNSCSVCGSTKILTVSTSKGGFICTNCHTNEKIVDKKTIQVLRMLYFVDISKISKINLSEETKSNIDNFINEYYDKYAGLYLKSKKFLKSIKNVYIK